MRSLRFPGEGDDQFRRRAKRAKYRRWTLKIFLASLTDDEKRVIERVFGITPQVFRQACQGRKFLDLPPWLVQREFDFTDD